MISAILLWLGTMAVVAGLCLHHHCRTMARLKKRIVFEFNWHNARRMRQLWLAEHYFLANPFDDFEYEQLWMLEIGAELVLKYHFDRIICVSYNEYLAEREQQATS